MAQLLIVDDEAHVVDRLAATVDWQAAGVEQVFKAYSGVEALELLRQFSIDIVVSDIRMPGMSGLELIAEIRGSWPKTKCILLSGYSDFNYAKEAIRHQAEAYLLKPVKEEELTAAVRSAIGKLEEEWEEVISQQRLSYVVKENLPLMRASLLLDLLQGRIPEEAALREKMGLLELSGGEWSRCSLMIVRLDELFLQYGPQNPEWKEYAIGNMAGELFGPRYAIWPAKDAYGYYVYAMAPRRDSPHGHDAAWFERTAADLQTAVSSYLKAKISVMVCKEGRFPEEIPGLYGRLVDSFRGRIGDERELFMRLEDTGLDAGIKPLESLYEPPALIRLFDAGKWSEMENKLQRVYAELESDGAGSQELLLEVYFTLAGAYAYIAHKNGRQLSDLLGGDYAAMTEAPPFRSVNQLKEWSLRTLRRIREDMQKETKDSRADLIRSIQRYVEEQITGSLSLQAVADRVHLHPVYLSKLYKLETGENLSDYMQAARMAKAEELLKGSSAKIYEIAASLGYQRPHSFNFAFKKQFGMTPQEYRDLYADVQPGTPTK
ncbi:response regulator [Paenibacillus sp. P22]|uniref:response regulator transcription factor n=1 Tax=Paenibacillus sp. P22 TaxID=483908 RepID=UPI000432733F|nr:response regulator [Paenibacillus sp. P22]CDN43502.1 AraC family transcriptional regulator [Paenibacillus sp. P22]